MKMHELQSPEAVSSAASTLATLSTLFWKFMPAPLGALVMVIFDMPKTRTELFWRLVVSFIASIMLGETVFDLLHSFSWLSFLDMNRRPHVAAVDFLVGGAGWSMLAGWSTFQRKFRGDPVSAIEDAKKAAT